MSKNTNFNMMIPHYEKSIASMKEKIVACESVGDESRLAQLSKDIRDTERMIRDIKSDQVKKPHAGVDEYLK